MQRLVAVAVGGLLVLSGCSSSDGDEIATVPSSTSTPPEVVAAGPTTTVAGGPTSRPGPAGQARPGATTTTTRPRAQGTRPAGPRTTTTTTRVPRPPRTTTTTRPKPPGTLPPLPVAFCERLASGAIDDLAGQMAAVPGVEGADALLAELRALREVAPEWAKEWVTWLITPLELLRDAIADGTVTDEASFLTWASALPPDVVPNLRKGVFNLQSFRNKRCATATS